MQTDAQIAAIMLDAYSVKPTVQGPNDVCAVLHWFADELVIATPGTRTVPGWIKDFEFWPEDDVRLGRCHSGFLRNGQALWALIKADVMRAEAAGKRVTYAGHSLGASEAQICAGMHLAMGARDVRVAGFGSPRVALWVNRRFRRLFDGVSVNLWKRAGDPVCHVPPIWWFGHIRENVVIGAVEPGSNPSWPLDPINDKNHGIALYAKDMAAQTTGKLN